MVAVLDCQVDGPSLSQVVRSRSEGVATNDCLTGNTQVYPMFAEHYVISCSAAT